MSGVISLGIGSGGVTPFVLTGLYVVAVAPGADGDVTVWDASRFAATIGDRTLYTASIGDLTRFTVTVGDMERN